MGLFDSFFTITKEEKTPEPVKKSSEPKIVHEFEESTTTSAYLNMNTKPDEESLNFFQELLNANKEKGFEFLGFMEAVSNPKLMVIPTEANRYSAAFVGLSVAGATKEDIINTANNYVSLINNEVENINISFENSTESEVNQKHKLIKEKEAEIAALTERITTLKNETFNLNKEAADTSVQLTKSKMSLIAAAEKTTNFINSEVEKIKNYL